MTVTLDLPAEAQARLQAEATRRGVTLDQLIAELADQLPAETPTAEPGTLEGFSVPAIPAIRVGRPETFINCATTSRNAVSLNQPDQRAAR